MKQLVLMTIPMRTLVFCVALGFLLDTRIWHAQSFGPAILGVVPAIFYALWAWTGYIGRSRMYGWPLQCMLVLLLSINLAKFISEIMA
ncbi:MAG: hypothetical protein V4582_18415 [Pseudomonadota bacterium]